MPESRIAKNFANYLRYPTNQVQADFWDRNKILYAAAERISINRKSFEIIYINKNQGSIFFNIASLKTQDKMHYNHIDGFIKLILLSLIFEKDNKDNNDLFIDIHNYLYAEGNNDDLENKITQYAFKDNRLLTAKDADDFKLAVYYAIKAKKNSEHKETYKKLSEIVLFKSHEELKEEKIVNVALLKTKIVDSLVDKIDTKISQLKSGNFFGSLWQKNRALSELSTLLQTPQLSDEKKCLEIQKIKAKYPDYKAGVFSSETADIFADVERYLNPKFANLKGKNAALQYYFSVTENGTDLQTMHTLSPVAAKKIINRIDTLLQKINTVDFLYGCLPYNETTLDSPDTLSAIAEIIKNKSKELSKTENKHLAELYIMLWLRNPKNLTFSFSKEITVNSILTAVKNANGLIHDNFNIKMSFVSSLFSDNKGIDVLTDVAKTLEIQRKTFIKTYAIDPKDKANDIQKKVEDWKPPSPSLLQRCCPFVN